MTTIASLLHDGLVADSSVNALVGARVYPSLLPETPTYPALTYQRISNVDQSETGERKESRWQIDCWAETYGGAQTSGIVVKTALRGWHKADATPGINWARIVNDIDDYDEIVMKHRVIVDVMLTTTGD